MLITPLKPGDVIGLASPSHIAKPEKYAPIIQALEGMGYRVKTAQNLYAHSWGYSASDRERADDLHQLVLDDEVRMILFGGGDGGDEVAPRLDYDLIAAHPKIWLSYSDSTSILNSVHTLARLPVFYGQMPALFPDISDYNLDQFRRFITQPLPDAHVPHSEWISLHSGVAHGRLVGGYLENFIFLSGVGRIRVEPDEKLVLFLEDHEKFYPMEHESTLLSRLEQSPIMRHVSGVLFGHYSAPVNESLLRRLKLLGDRLDIPVVYCDDFGHGENHAILPIGANCTLDADAQCLNYHGWA